MRALIGRNAGVVGLFMWCGLTIAWGVVGDFALFFAAWAVAAVAVALHWYGQQSAKVDRLTDFLPAPLDFEHGLELSEVTEALEPYFAQLDADPTARIGGRQARRRERIYCAGPGERAVWAALIADFETPRQSPPVAGRPPAGQLRPRPDRHAWNPPPPCTCRPGSGAVATPNRDCPLHGVRGRG